MQTDSRSNPLKMLLEGNARWITGHPIHPHIDMDRRRMLADKGQNPFAVILSCADSRVPPELVFDTGVGDLFVVRVAGNSLDKIGQQSLQYATEHLGVRLIMVMGHQGCGAIKGAVDSYPGPAPEFLSTIYRAIEKSQEVIRERGGNADDKAALAREAVDRHVIRMVHKLRGEAPFVEAIGRGLLAIVGARYD
ncbi:MAG TPA: carbonic anhydrase, partial [Candidatus Binataceae bacterium]|nr:carbonic anhydrase [Candidatus Binataceae bacterium]